MEKESYFAAALSGFVETFSGMERGKAADYGKKFCKQLSIRDAAGSRRM